MDTAEDRFNLIELDLNERPAPTRAQMSAPTPTVTPVEPTPLDYAKHLIDSAESFTALRDVAGRLNSKGADGVWFRALPEATQNEIRLYWRTRRDAFLAGLRKWWAQAWHFGPLPSTQPSATENTATIVEALGVVAAEAAANAEAHRTAVPRDMVRPAGTAPTRGIVHEPQGVNASELSGEALRRHLRQAVKTDAARREEAQREAEARERERVLIAGLVETREGLCVSPGEAHKGFKISAKEFRAALGARFAHLAPKIRTSKAQFGEIMRSLRGNGLVAYAATKEAATTDWPADVVARYVVGKLDVTKDLSTLGAKEVVADLVRVETDANGNKLDKPRYEIRFEGGTEDVRERLAAEFERRVEDEVLTVTYLGQWFRNTVLAHYHAIKWGGFWFVPGTEADTQELVDLIELLVGDNADDGQNLIGRDIGVGSTTTNDRWSRGVARTLLSDLQKIAKAFEGNTEDARSRARKRAADDGLDEAAQDLAAQRAKASAEAARSRLKELDKLTTLIEGYKLLIGDEYERVIGQVRALRAAIFECLDEGSVRATLLELDTDAQA